MSDESDPVTYEKISVTLDRAKEAGGWYGIALSKAFLNKADIEETIKSMGYIGRVGMRSTDTEILNVMIDRADINQGC